MKLTLYWSYATRSLLRGGQRTVLAIFCVAVGVMAIVALQLVGLSVNQALIGNIVEANGGDIRVNADLAPLRQRDLAFFDQLKQQGRISAYATSNSATGSILQSTGSEERFGLVAISSNFPLVGQANFIAPSSDVTLQSVVSGHDVAMSLHVFQDLKAHIGSTYQVKTLDGRVIPIRVAAEFQEDGAFRGPQILISQTTYATTPGPTGDSIPAAFGSLYITLPQANIQPVKTQISHTFPTVRVITAPDLLKQRQTQVDQIQLFLHIVGLLALFIGGIGIINTMQVLLRRRRVEIAMLKTAGYQQRDLYGLFGLEAALLGIMGGILGTGAGVAASYLVRTIVERTFLLHLPIVQDNVTIFSGLLIGLATALIFGLLPIVQASQIRPLAVLRDSNEHIQAGSRLTTALLLLLLSILFVVLASIVLGDLVTAVIAVYGGAVAVLSLGLGLGLLVLAISKLPVYDHPRWHMLRWIGAALGGVILAAAAFAALAYLGELLNQFLSRHGYSTPGVYALVVLGGLGTILLGGALIFFLATLVDGVVMFAPRSWKTPVMLAYRNMGRQRLRTTTTLTALFVGVFAIGLILILGQGIKDTINTTLNSLFTRNVFVVASPKQQASIASQLPTIKGIDNSKTVANPVVPRIYPLLLGGRDIGGILSKINRKDKIDAGDVTGALGSIEGFTLQQGGNNIPTITLTTGRNLNASDTGTNDIVVSSNLQQVPVGLHLGDSIIIQSADGAVTKALKIVGFYDAANPSGNTNFGAILADQQVVMQLGRTQTLEVFSLKVDPDQLANFKLSLNRIAPSAQVISVVDIDTLINSVLDNLIILLTTLASLAMIAGLIIIANAVALAMLERQREIGILKAVGYTSKSILATVLIENGMIGLLGSLVAMLLVAGAITALSQYVFGVQITVGPWFVVLIISATALITMLVALLVSWKSVRVRPLEVLRYE